MKFIMIMVLGFFIMPRAVISQKNSVEIQTGLLHWYFDGNPILNIKHPFEGKKSIHTLFNDLFYNSIGVNYGRQINPKIKITAEYSTLHILYLKNLQSFDSFPIFNKRYWRKFGLRITSHKIITPKIKLTYGLGFNYRRGFENLILGKYYAELFMGGVQYRDFGIITSLGSEQKIGKHFFSFESFDYNYFFYIWDKKGRDYLKTFYNSNQYPSIHDLSFHLGVGYRF